MVTPAPTRIAEPSLWGDIGLLLLDSAGRVTGVSEAFWPAAGQISVWGHSHDQALAALSSHCEPAGSWVSYPVPLRAPDHEPGTALLVFQPGRHVDRTVLDALDQEVKAIIDCSFDQVHVTDGRGTTLRVSAQSNEYFGLPAERMIGMSLEELERRGLARPLATRMVMEKRRRVTMLQETVMGRRLLVTGHPVFDRGGDLTRIVITAQDVTAVDRLTGALEEARSLVRAYQRELDLLRREQRDDPIVHRSKAMEQLIGTARRVAEVDCTVLIQGETGVGKEVLARAIRRWSPRADKPFVAVNCGAIPEALIESELFGYDEGAFTGARREGKPGLVEAANGGILFLDEVGELPLPLQVKLLRVLEERQVTRVGAVKPIAVDLRVVAATNRDLEALTREGRFRQDLFYRLNVVPLTVPPLRQRPEDVLPLANHFLEEYRRRYGRDKRLSPASADALMGYSWPGNVRELANLMERLAVTIEDPIVHPEHLPGPIGVVASADRPPIQVNRLLPLKEAVVAVEEALLREAYAQGGSSYKAAELLGVHQSTVVRKLKRLTESALLPCSDRGAGDATLLKG